MNSDAKEQMLERVERVWHQTYQLEEIHRLATESPELAGAIYEFLELVVGIEHEATEPIAIRMRRDGRVRRYLEQSGFAAAAAVAPSSSVTTTSLIQNLRRATDMDVASIATALEVSTSFLVGLQDQLDRFPASARQEIARRMQAAVGLTSGTVAAFLVPRGARTAQRAARSRSGAASQPSSLTFEQFIANVGLSPEQATYWLSLRADA